MFRKASHIFSHFCNGVVTNTSFFKILLKCLLMKLLKVLLDSKNACAASNPV